MFYVYKFSGYASGILLLLMVSTWAFAQQSSFENQRDIFLKSISEAEFKIDTVISSQAKSRGKKLKLEMTYVTDNVRYKKRLTRKLLKGNVALEKVSIKKSGLKFAKQRRMNGKNLFAMTKESFVIRKLYADELLIITPQRSSPSKWKPLYYHNPR